MFCKRCGVAGHYTCKCPLTEYRATRWLMKRLEGIESIGFTILYGPLELSFYSNMIQGLSDSFRNKNTRVNLLCLGLHVDNGGHAFHGGYGVEEDVNPPGGNEQGNVGNGNITSPDTEPEYFPATESLSSEEDYLVSNDSQGRVNVWQLYGMQ